MNKRPVLAGALADLKAGKADVLAVSKLDRPSRDLADFATMLETSDRERWDLICLDTTMDTRKAEGRFMAQILCTFAEPERKRIGERTREGMAKLSPEQKRRVGRQSQQDPDILARIVERHKEGHSLSRIARDLTADGVPTAAGGK
jgi:DNA invertase Pin-like site-specific DNA recombinase